MGELQVKTMPEQTVVAIMRRLSPERKQQVVDFVRFVEAEALKTGEEMLAEPSPEEIAADIAAWDELFETEQAQTLLDKLADEALAEIRAGKTTEIIVTAEGELAKG